MMRRSFSGSFGGYLGITFLIGALSLTGAACGSAAPSVPHANSTTASITPSAASTSAASAANAGPGYTSKCVPGIDYETGSGNITSFYPITAIPSDTPSGVTGTDYGYQLTVTNNTSQPEHVQGFAVVFIAADGNTGDGEEMASDSQLANVWILPGKSWTWQKMPWSYIPGNPEIDTLPEGAVENQVGFDTGATCQLVSLRS